MKRLMAKSLKKWFLLALLGLFAYLIGYWFGQQHQAKPAVASVTEDFSISQ